MKTNIKLCGGLVASAASNNNSLSINWGDVPTWVAALGAIVTAIIYYRLLRGEIRKREEEKRELETFTQRRISAWIENKVLMVQNKGYEPVYHLVVYLGAMGVSFRPDSGEHVEMVIGTLGPDQKLEEDVSKYNIETGIFPDIPSVELEFTDCEGKHWVRKANGSLKEVNHRRPFD